MNPFSQILFENQPLDQDLLRCLFYFYISDTNLRYSFETHMNTQILHFFNLYQLRLKLLPIQYIHCWEYNFPLLIKIEICLNHSRPYNSVNRFLQPQSMTKDRYQNDKYSQFSTQDVKQLVLAQKHDLSKQSMVHSFFVVLQSRKCFQKICKLSDLIYFSIFVIDVMVHLLQIQTYLNSQQTSNFTDQIEELSFHRSCNTITLISKDHQWFFQFSLHQQCHCKQQNRNHHKTAQFIQGHFFKHQMIYRIHFNLKGFLEHRTWVFCFTFTLNLENQLSNFILIAKIQNLTIITYYNFCNDLHIECNIKLVICKLQNFMGNQTTRPSPSNTRHRNRYSLDASVFNNYKQSKIMPSSIYSKQLGSSIELKNIQQSKQDSLIEQLNTSSIKQQKSGSKKEIDKKQQQAKLQKLTKANDELRKQLMKISEELTQKLKKKKKPLYQSKRERVQSQQKTQNNKKNQYKIIALKKQLQNGYRQIDRYKKQVQELKKNTPNQPNRQQQLLQQKIKLVQHQIIDSLQQIESLKAVLNHQQNGLKLFQNDEQQEDVIQVKRQIQQLKDRLKKFKKIQRKKQENQKKKGEYMIQLQRKLRQLNGQYLPQFKNYSNKNFQLQNPITDKKKKSQQSFRYLPSKIQINQVEKELEKLKTKHEEYHTKIQKSLKTNVQLKNERQKIKDRLFQIQKNTEFLNYKKDRYMQLVMGNISHLSSQDLFDKSDLSHSDQDNGENQKVITKGEDIQGQVPFDDHSIFKGKSLDKIKIVTANVWISTDGLVTALQFYYTDQDNFYIGNRSTLRTQYEQQKITFELGEGDFLRNIMGIWNKKKYLQLLVLQSYKGKVKKFGKESINGKNFNLGLSKLHRPSCAVGASIYDGKYWRINKLQFQISS